MAVSLNGYTGANDFQNSLWGRKAVTNIAKVFNSSVHRVGLQEVRPRPWRTVKTIVLKSIQREIIFCASVGLNSSSAMVRDSMHGTNWKDLLQVPSVVFGSNGVRVAVTCKVILSAKICFSGRWGKVQKLLEKLLV